MGVQPTNSWSPVRWTSSWATEAGSNLVFFEKKKKKKEFGMLSAAVVIGALKVNTSPYRVDKN